MLDREGAAGPADVAIVGSEREVNAQLDRLAEIGVSDFLAVPFGSGPGAKATVERTRALLMARRNSP
jgi:alkanesulfonate monooxygenase SsuD/methylene tetrahydromethanopterin reductase-like flavin-dependent oxidoreductase (luciferase family)